MDDSKQDLADLELENERLQPEFEREKTIADTY